MKKSNHNVLMIGDVTGLNGQKAITQFLKKVIQQYKPICVIANCENAHESGYGLDKHAYNIVKNHGVHIITLGNHATSHKDIHSIMEQDPNVIAPANMITSLKKNLGYQIMKVDNIHIGVVNLIGNDSMLNHSNNVFQYAEKIINMIYDRCDAIFIDIHAISAEEKFTLANFLAGKITAICGTHCHCPTSDARIIKMHTGYQTDIGMCGDYSWSHESKTYRLMKKFTPWLHYKYFDDQADITFCGTIINFNIHNGACIKITPVILSNHLINTI